MQKRNILNSPRLLEMKRRKRRVLQNKILLSIFAFLIIFAGLTYISRFSVLNINSVEIIGNKVIDTQAIEKVVKRQIEGKYLWLIPKTNILLYPTNDIKKELDNKFKRLKDITFSIKNKKTLVVSLAERIGLYTWCGIVPTEQNSDSNQKCYFLDKDGYIFDESPYFSGEVYFKFYGLTELIEDVPSGFYFLKQNFQKLTLLKETFENMGLKPVALYLLDNGDVKIFLSTENSLFTGPEIIFKIDSDFKKIAENLEVALTTEPLQTDFKNKYSSLLYIDLRFGNKVYFKFK